MEHKKTVNENHPLILAGFKAEDIAVWDERFASSGLGITYEEWCIGVIALNRMGEADKLEAAAINTAFNDAIRSGGFENLFKKYKKTFQTGSYKRKKR